MKIVDALLEKEMGAVLADENNGVVRLWTLHLPFWDGRTLHALRHYFSNLEVRGGIIRLGGFRSWEEAKKALESTRVVSRSLSIRKLYCMNLLSSVK